MLLLKFHTWISTLALMILLCLNHYQLNSFLFAFIYSTVVNLIGTLPYARHHAEHRIGTPYFPFLGLCVNDDQALTTLFLVTKPY